MTKYQRQGNWALLRLEEPRENVDFFSKWCLVELEARRDMPSNMEDEVSIEQSNAYSSSSKPLTYLGYHSNVFFGITSWGREIGECSRQNLWALSRLMDTKSGDIVDGDHDAKNHMLSLLYSSMIENAATMTTTVTTRTNTSLSDTIVKVWCWPWHHWWRSCDEPSDYCWLQCKDLNVSWRLPCDCPFNKLVTDMGKLVRTSG